MYRRIGIADIEGAHDHLRRITEAAGLPFAPPDHAPNVPGAQPREVFARVIARLREHPG